MKSLNYFFPTMQASHVTLCQDVVSAPISVVEGQGGLPNSADSSEVQYKVLAGMQIQINAEYDSRVYSKLLRMHGNTGNLGMEDSCHHYSIKSGKAIKLVRVGQDDVLDRFTYISFTPEGSSTIEFG